MSKILYISSEAFPLIKTGGLADVAGSLPTALSKLGQETRLLLPAYTQVMQQVQDAKPLASGDYYGLEVSLLETCLPNSGVPVWLVNCPAAFNRPDGGPYLDSTGQPWDDNALRFALFCRVAVDIALDKLKLGWQPDIVHCNDWQSGLVPALLQPFKQRPATVFTIHNLAYQGLFNHQTFLDLELPADLWHPERLEFYDQLSFIKGGLVYADRINAVSPTYASEILQPEFGNGVDGLLQHRQERLSGILNGIDQTIWNPATDPHLTANYDSTTLKQKRKNKTALQKQLGLPVDARIPLVGMISRMVEQKGFDIILEAMGEIVNLPVQLVILGSGDSHYEIQLMEWASRHPDKLKVVVGYDESLSHLIEAGSDMFLMPSTFEPCGLNQLYSLRYGTLPIVRKVGGLADTVVDANEVNRKNKTANGFIVTEQSASALLTTLHNALKRYQEKSAWHQLQLTAMQSDFSWRRSAEHYLALYQQAIADRNLAVGYLAA